MNSVLKRNGAIGLLLFLYTLQPEQFEKAVATLNSAGLIQSYPDFKSFIAR